MADPANKLMTPVSFSMGLGGSTAADLERNIAERRKKLLQAARLGSPVSTMLGYPTNASSLNGF